MLTRTLLEAIAEIKSKDNATRFKILLDLFEVYSIPFSRQNAMQIFGTTPATFKFISYDKFQCEKCIFQPDTMADYISIVSAMGLSLKPDFDSAYNATEPKTETDRKYRETIQKAVTLYWSKRR